MRAPGMTLMKMPIFVWSVLGSMVLISVRLPYSHGDTGMLALDRTTGHAFLYRLTAAATR